MHADLMGAAGLELELERGVLTGRGREPREHAVVRRRPRPAHCARGARTPGVEGRIAAERGNDGAPVERPTTRHGRTMSARAQPVCRAPVPRRDAVGGSMPAMGIDAPHAVHASGTRR